MNIAYIPFFLWIAETVGLHAVQPIEILQDQAQRILVDYTRSRYPQQPGRIGRLMILVGYLRCVSSKTVERLFFHETIGEIPISRLLVDMYQMEKYINWSAFAHRTYTCYINVSGPASPRSFPKLFRFFYIIATIEWNKNFFRRSFSRFCSI